MMNSKACREHGAVLKTMGKMLLKFFVEYMEILI